MRLGPLAALALLVSAGAACAQPITLRQTRGAPRIAAPKSAAVAAINVALAKLDREARAFSRECHGSVDRSVSVPFAGPEFLAVAERQAYYCDHAAHPDTLDRVYVYDLRPGSLADWPSLLRGNASWAYGDDSIAVRSPRLRAFYAREHKQHAEDDCRDAFDGDDQAFMIWPDKARGGLAVAPFDPPHVIAACAETYVIPTGALVRFGIDPRLAASLGAAGR